MPDRPLRIYSDGTQFHTGAGIRTGSVLFNRVYNEKGGIVRGTVPPCNYLSLISSIFFSIFLITSRKTASSCPVGFVQSPVDDLFSRNIRAGDIAAHGHINICFRYIIQKFGVLLLFHIYSIFPLHQSYRVLIDLRLDFCSGGIAFISIRQVFLPERFRNLTPAGVMNTDKRSLFFFAFALENGHLFPIH